VFGTPDETLELAFEVLLESMTALNSQDQELPCDHWKIAESKVNLTCTV